MGDSFGAHIKRLREARRLTQEELAERSNLATDTIRRLEHQNFSPSLRTLRKVCMGLDLSVSAMFNSYELEGMPEEVTRINSLLAGRSRDNLKVVERVVTALIHDLELTSEIPDGPADSPAEAPGGPADNPADNPADTPENPTGTDT